MRGEQFPRFDPTPKERGILAGLADRWGENPYPRGEDGYYESPESQRYTEGFTLGLRLLELTKETA